MAERHQGVRRRPPHLLHADAEKKTHHRIVGPFDAADCVQDQHHLFGARRNHRKAARFDFALAQLAFGALPLGDSRKLGANRLDQFEPRIGRLDSMIAVKLDKRSDVTMRHHRNHNAGLQPGRERDSSLFQSVMRDRSDTQLATPDR